MSRLLLHRARAMLFTVMLLLYPNSYVYAQAACPNTICIYLPQVSRPPSVYVLRRFITDSNHRLVYPVVYGEIANDSGIKVHNVVLSVTIKSFPSNAITSYSSTVSTPASVSSHQVVPFDISLMSLASESSSFLLDARVMTWTTTSDLTQRDVFVISITTGVSTIQRDMAVITTTIQNTTTELLKDVHLYVWSFNTFGTVTCTSQNCLSKKTVAMLAPGELYTETVQWQSVGLIPKEAVRVVAQGVISP